MTDIIDQADQRIEQEREASYRRIATRLEYSGATHCDDCGEPIPEARRAVAPFATRCIHCQERAERSAA